MIFFFFFDKQRMLWFNYIEILNVKIKLLMKDAITILYKFEESDIEQGFFCEAFTPFINTSKEVTIRANV